jgi:hypothetical protein
MIIILFIEAIEEVSSCAQFLQDINLIGRLVYLVDTNNVGVIELAHDEDFVAKLLESFNRVDQCC